MGRPPSNGGPSFRFNAVEVGEMEAILQAHNYTVPAREILEALAHRFSTSADRAGKVEVSSKQVWNWFQNRRYALRARAAKTSFPAQVSAPPVPRDDQSVVRNVPQALHPQAPQPQLQASQPLPAPAPAPAPPTTVKSMPQVSQPLSTLSAQTAGRNASENSQMEFEAKSARDGAWYDVASFLSHRSLDSGDPEALVRFAGFGPEEDEWVNIRRHIRQRSLPCESLECVAVLPGDLILCFQEGKEQALYFDAHVLDAQRRRHDVRGCRCRFLVRYDHDQSEEIVPLRKICRRPETDYRLQQLHGGQVTVHPQKTGIEAQARNFKVDGADGQTQKQPKQEQRIDTLLAPISATPTNVKIADSGNTTSITTNVSSAIESNLQPSKIADPGNTTSVPTNVSLANESILPPSKVVDSGNTTSVPISVSSAATESSLPPSKIADSGNTTSIPTNVSSATIESSLPQSMIADSGNTTSFATNVSSVSNESNLPPSKIADSGDIASVPTNVSSAVIESNLLPSKYTDSGTTTSVPTNVSPAAIESNLQPSQTTDSRNTASVPTNVSSATIESELSKIADSENMTFVPTNVSSAVEPNLQPSEVANSGNTTSVPTTVSLANESNLQPSEIVDSGNSASTSTVLLPNESNLSPSKIVDSGNTSSLPINVSLAHESNLSPSKIDGSGNTTSIPANVSLVSEPNLPPSEVSVSGNATSGENTSSANAVAMEITAADVPDSAMDEG